MPESMSALFGREAQISNLPCNRVECVIYQRVATSSCHPALNAGMGLIYQLTLVLTLRSKMKTSKFIFHVVTSHFLEVKTQFCTKMKSKSIQQGEANHVPNENGTHSNTFPGVFSSYNFSGLLGFGGWLFVCLFVGVFCFVFFFLFK